MKALVDTARGVGKFKKFNHDGPVDKKKWSKDSLEWVVIHLIKERYLSMKFVTSAYMTNSYVIAGHKAGQVRSIGNCERSFKRPILMNFRKAKQKATRKRKKPGADSKSANSPGKRKRVKCLDTSVSSLSSSSTTTAKISPDCGDISKIDLSMLSSSSSSSSSSDSN